MKICLYGKRLDTTKVTHHWELSWYDRQSNCHSGDVYLSSKDTWYVYTPSQWSNGHTWELSTPDSILEDYREYLTDVAVKEIVEL